MIAKEHFEYIDDRFEQLITESKDVAERQHTSYSWPTQAGPLLR
jgi:hypothetical protein